MKRFCLPGLPYSQCMILPSFSAEIITSVISGHTKALLAQSTLIDKTG
jgi:hypothetical protein